MLTNKLTSNWQNNMYVKQIMVSAVIGLALSASLPIGAQAQAPNRIKQFNAWGAYSHTGTTGKVCYVLSIPTLKEPADRDHGDVFFMLSQHPGQNVSLEPQFRVGYPFQAESKVILNIDGKTFNMFTKGANAWMENPAEEQSVVNAMRAGRSMNVVGKSRRGTQTKYAYSLSGVTASINEIKNCK